MIITEQKKPQKVLDAMRNLQSNLYYQEIISWIKECSKTEEACYDRIMDDHVLRLNQGRHQALSAIIEANDGVRDSSQNKK